MVDFNAAINVAVRADVNVNVRDRPEEYRPPHWDYIDYDQYRRPAIYNPLDIDLTYRYYYDGDYREVYVPRGGRIVLNLAIVGVFPFTAVGLNGFVSVGSFNGGCWVPPVDYDGPPPDDWHPYQPTVYNDMTVDVPSVQSSVMVNRVTFVGHDDTRPAGQQDAFMLDDSRLAYGTVQDGRDGGTIVVNASQATPGVGPVDDGGPIIKTTLANAEKPLGTNYTPYLVAAMVLVAIIAGGVITYVVRHPRGAHSGPGDPPTQNW